MGYYLLDRHRNRHKQPGPASDPDTRPWYTTRRNPVTAIVIHTPETLEDFVAPYDEAERIAAYGATITRASWHATIDADSTIPMLPSSYTAWHVRGYNSRTIGYEIGAKATSWSRAPAEWVTGVLENAAAYARIDAERYGIPPRFLTRAQVDAGMKGFTSHAQLDPTRRTDPGADFPWGRFLSLVEGGDMIDRKTTVGPNSKLEEDFDQMRELKVFTTFTDPGGVVFKDELAAFLNRYFAYVVKPEIAAQNKTAWVKAQTWVRDHVKSSIAAALAAGAGAGANYEEIAQFLADRIAGG